MRQNSVNDKLQKAEQNVLMLQVCIFLLLGWKGQRTTVETRGAKIERGRHDNDKGTVKTLGRKKETTSSWKRSEN